MNKNRQVILRILGGSITRSIWVVFGFCVLLLPAISGCGFPSGLEDHHFDELDETDQIVVKDVNSLGPDQTEKLITVLESSEEIAPVVEFFKKRRRNWYKPEGTSPVVEYKCLMLTSGGKVIRRVRIGRSFVMLDAFMRDITRSELRHLYGLLEIRGNK